MNIELTPAVQIRAGWTYKPHVFLLAGKWRRRRVPMAFLPLTDHEKKLQEDATVWCARENARRERRAERERQRLDYWPWNVRA